MLEGVVNIKYSNEIEIVLIFSKCTAYDAMLVDTVLTFKRNFCLLDANDGL